MYALTVKQPWAQAIAQFGKNVENRKTRPPAALIGQRIAIHVAKTWPHDGELWGAMEVVKQHCSGLAEWNYLHRELRFQRLPPPHAGRIIATARLVGFDGEASGTYAHPLHVDTVQDAYQSPWNTGPVGWVLADVVMLLDPVGSRPAWGCVACKAAGMDVQEGARCPQCNAKPGYLRRYDHTIRGQLGCWKVAPELAAQVQEQEQMARGRR